MNARASVSLLLKQRGSPTAEVLDHGLRAAGFRVVLVPTVYDAPIAADRAGERLRHVIVGLDYFGRNEFRLFPTVQREWPGATIVAYHSPGFGYKGRIAELLGADVVLTTAEDASEFIASLAPTVPPMPAEPQAPPIAAAAARPAAEPPSPAATPEETAAPEAAAPAAHERTPEASPVPAPSPAAEAYLAQAAAPEAPDAEEEAAVAETAWSGEEDGAESDLAAEEGSAEQDVLGTIELTEEELRLLLGEEDDA